MHNNSTFLGTYTVRLIITHVLWILEIQ